MQKFPASHAWKATNFFFVNDLEETRFLRKRRVDPSLFIKRRWRVPIRKPWEGRGSDKTVPMRRTMLLPGRRKTGRRVVPRGVNRRNKFSRHVSGEEENRRRVHRSRYIRANPGRRRGEATRNRRNEDKWITFRSLLCKNIPEPRFADYLYLDLWIKSLIFPPPGFRSIQCIYDVIRRFDLRCLPKIKIWLITSENISIWPRSISQI